MIWVFLLGMLAGALILRAGQLISERDLKIPWWGYVLAVVLLLWTAYGTIFAVDSFMEYQTKAGVVFLVITWVVTIAATTGLVRKFQKPVKT